MIACIRRHTEPLKDRIVVGPLLIASPLLLMTSYLWCADHWFRWTTLTDTAALAIIMLIGVAGLYLLPLSRLTRSITALPYIALVGWLMMLWAIVWRGGL
jgi:hypothetical protein